MQLNYQSREIQKLYISAKVADNEQKAVDFIFDNQVIKDAADEVSHTGKIKVSLPFTLPYMDPEMKFVALVVPVSSDITNLNGTIVDEKRFFNVVTVVLNITQTLRNTLLNEQHERSNIEIMLSTPDIAGRLQELLLYEQKAEDYGLQDLIANPYDNFSEKLAISKSLNFGSSVIKVVIQPSYAYLSDATKTGPWIAFLLGIILTIFAGYWVHLQIAQTIKIQDIVHDRTKELKDSNKALDDFVYIVSHDLKEPLRGIYAFSQFLLEDYEDKLDEDGVNKLQTLKKLASRMEDLIETLLQYSRLGRTDLAFQRVQINEVISNTLELIEPIYETENVHIRVQQNMPSIYCDTARVSEIFRNLIINGIKYNDSEAKIIEIGCTTKHPDCEGCLTFFIKDNGIGIDEERHEDIFKMFKRLHGRDEYGGGTGSGLPIVKKIIERHNGKIWVEKNAEGGSSFFFTLQKNAV
jgi:signal transduction histidine kinase